MRVISGTAKGHNLFSPPGFETRPTSDRLREAVFSSAGERVVGSRFLDLFAGTGAVGVEALSRGAEFAVFADVSRECCEIIEKNLRHTKLINKSEIITLDALAAVRKLSGRGRFGAVFLDPPYGSGLIETVLPEMARRGVLEERALVIVECSANEKIILPDCYELLKIKNYGRASVMYCEYGGIN